MCTFMHLVDTFKHLFAGNQTHKHYSPCLNYTNEGQVWSHYELTPLCFVENLNFYTSMLASCINDVKLCQAVFHRKLLDGFQNIEIKLYGLFLVWTLFFFSLCIPWESNPQPWHRYSHSLLFVLHEQRIVVVTLGTKRSLKTQSFKLACLHPVSVLSMASETPGNQTNDLDIVSAML